MSFVLSHGHGAIRNRKQKTSVAAPMAKNVRAARSAAGWSQSAAPATAASGRKSPKFSTQNHSPASPCIHPGANRRADGAVKFAVTIRTSHVAGMMLTIPITMKGRPSLARQPAAAQEARTALRKRKAGALKSGMEAYSAT